MNKQSTSCYCPGCKGELCSTGSYVAQIKNLVVFECISCKLLSQWDFDAPVPLLLKTEQPGNYEALDT